MLHPQSPNATSSLTNGINIVMELIRRYCSEIEHAEFQFHEYQIQCQTNPNIAVSPNTEKLKALATDLNDLFTVLKERIKSFKEILEKPRSVVSAFLFTLL